jgi:hypothetical protein
MRTKQTERCTDYGTHRFPLIGAFGLSISGSGVLIDLVPIVYQRPPDAILPCFLVIIFILLVTDHFLGCPPISGRERLVPAAVTEL